MKLIKAIADYDDPDPDFAGLSFKKGDLIFLKDTVDENWAEGFNISEKGKFFPLNFTDEIERKKVRVKAYTVKKGSRPQGTRVESQMIRTLPQKKKHKSKSKSKKSKNYKKITKRKKKIKRKTHMK